MKAAVFRAGKIVVDTLPDPVPSKARSWSAPLPAASAAPTSMPPSTPRQFVDLSRRAGSRWAMDPARDIVFGHEFCCEIVDYGPDTPARLAPGTLVTSMPMTLAGQTVQGIGYSNDIAGGFAQYMPLADRMLLPVPNGLAASVAALTEPIAVGWHAVENARLTPEDVPLVVGCGPVGLAVIAGLVLKHVHPIIAADYSPARRALALKMGADIVIDPGGDLALRDLAPAGDPRRLRRQPLCPDVRPQPQAAPRRDLRVRWRPRRHPADHGGRTRRCPHRRRRRLHGNRPAGTVLRHLQAIEPAVRPWLHRRRNSPKVCTTSPRARSTSHP